MTNSRITDAQTSALLDGHVPEGREDLQHLAAVIGELRLECFEAPPQPSASLAARLDLDRLAWVSATRGAVDSGRDRSRTTGSLQRSAPGRVKRALGWFTGLGIAAQIAVGAGAVGASAAGIGMAGALPAPAQQVFDAVVATVAPERERERPTTPAVLGPVDPVEDAADGRTTGGGDPIPAEEASVVSGGPAGDAAEPHVNGGSAHADGTPGTDAGRAGAEPRGRHADGPAGQPGRPGGTSAEARPVEQAKPSTAGRTGVAQRGTLGSATSRETAGDPTRTGDGEPAKRADRAEVGGERTAPEQTTSNSTAETADIGPEIP